MQALIHADRQDEIEVKVYEGQSIPDTYWVSIKTADGDVTFFMKPEQMKKMARDILHGIADIEISQGDEVNANS